MKYKTGLNEDIIKFYPSGNCTPGGIYFSREDILAFLGYGPWIRKVTLLKNSQVYENPGTVKKWKADKIILGRKRKITKEIIEKLIKEGANPKTSDNYPLQWASENGHLEIVKLLIPVSGPISKYSNEVIQCAADNGHLKIVKLLSKHCGYVMYNL